MKSRETASKKRIYNNKLYWVACVSCLIVVTLLVVSLLNNNATITPPQSIKATVTINNIAETTPTPTEVIDPAKNIVCRITLDINPSIEFQLGEDNLVIDVIGLNDDGYSLIKDIDFEGLTLENATIIVVNRLIAENYIHASMIDDDILLSVDGESVQADTLDIMTTIIKSAASQYELSIDTKQIEQNQLQIVLAEDKGNNNGGEFQLPPVDYDSLSTILRLEYIFERYAEVANIHVYPEDKDRLPDFIDFAGMPVMQSTFRGISDLIEKGYITDTINDGKVILDIPGYDDSQLADVIQLLDLMMQEACLSLDAIQSGSEQICLVSSNTPTSDKTVKFTLNEILDCTIHKKREEITELQLQILSMVYTAQEIDSMLIPRYWAVIPNIVGLTEEEAVYLCEQAGFVPDIRKESAQSEVSNADIGMVIGQDSNAGGTWEVGSKFMIFVLEEYIGPEIVIKDYHFENEEDFRETVLQHNQENNNSILNELPFYFILSNAPSSMMVRSINICEDYFTLDYFGEYEEYIIFTWHRNETSLGGIDSSEDYYFYEGYYIDVVEYKEYDWGYQEACKKVFWEQDGCIFYAQVPSEFTNEDIAQYFKVEKVGF